ncbi:MAG: hypothetical protein WC373_11435 [Smithella sp.]
MKKLILKTLLLTLVVCMPVSAMADVRIQVNIPLPPMIVFPALPQMVVIPDTDVYAVPDVEEDIFFYAGWWWRPWNNRWYRSRYYDRGWAYYPNPPYFHKNIPSDWKNNYKNHTWQGYRWEPQQKSHRDIERNWNVWQKNRYWKKQEYGVQKMKKNRPAPQYRSNKQQSTPEYTPRNKGKAPGNSKQAGKNDKRPFDGKDKR